MRDSIFKPDTVSPADTRKPSSLNCQSGGEGNNVSPSLQRLAYSVAEAATVSNLSRSKLYELLKTGELRSVKIAGRRLIRHADLLALLDLGSE